MIKYVTHNEIERNKWDTCIEESFNGMIYAKSWYLDLVAPNWDALIEDNYQSVFPLVHGRKWGIYYLYQPPFTQQLGLFSKNVLSEHLVGEFIQAIPRKFKFAEINLNTFNKFTALDVETFMWKTHELDLIKSYENIARNYSGNLKRNLKKSESHNLSLIKNSKPEEIIRIFRENRGQTITNLKDEQYAMFTRLVYAAIYKGLISTYGVFSPMNELCAGAIFLRSKKKVVFLFSGLTEIGKDLHAMPWLIDHFIRDNSQKHLTLDFEGSNDPDLARFYKGFGSKEITYPHLKINRLPWLLSTGVKMIKALR
ncbi:MAG: hypothetical protein KQI35_11865 [Bacteroidetes bacterium]|nr:hypothetical protein [Bacteroidota bacterium]